MTKSTWTIDAKARTATNGLGLTVEFDRDAKGWTASLQKADDSGLMPPQADAKALEIDALNVWRDELKRALDLLKRVGTALHGKEWIAPLANDLEINRISIQRWIKQENPLTMGHPIWKSIRAVIASQRDALKEIDFQIVEAMAGAEQVTGKRYAGNVAPADEKSTDEL